MQLKTCWEIPFWLVSRPKVKH